MFFPLIFCHPAFYLAFLPLLVHAFLEAHVDVVVSAPEVFALAFAAVEHSPGADVVVAEPAVSVPAFVAVEYSPGVDAVVAEPEVSVLVFAAA